MWILGATIGGWTVWSLAMILAVTAAIGSTFLVWCAARQAREPLTVDERWAAPGGLRR